MRRRTTLTWSLLGVVSLMVGYAALDAYDLAPGILTVAPMPTATPPPVPTVAPSDLRLPTLAPSGMPVRPAGADARLPSAAGVAAALAPVLADPAIAGGVGAVVADGVTGVRLLEVDAATPRIPASTAKLVSAAGILGSIDPSTTLVTSVVDGPNPGRITLVVGGDTMLNPGEGQPDSIIGRAGLADLADAVAPALKGDGRTSVVLGVDRSYAPGPRSAPTWPGDYIATGISGQVDVVGLATKRSTPEAPVVTDPVADVLTELATRLAERGVTATVDATLGPLPPVPAAVPASPASAGSPANPATAAIGSAASTTPTTPTTPTGLPSAPSRVLGSVRSAPVRDLVALALLDSDNALTESLARQAAFRAGRPTDFAGAAAYLLEVVRGQGLDLTGAVLVDASGLSRDNRLAPRSLADLLTTAASGKSPALASVVERLPIAALSGTLTQRFGDPAAAPAVGIVRAKTGTLTGVSALAGTVVTADGRPLVFVVLAPSPHGTPAARAALDRFGATLATCGCA